MFGAGAIRYLSAVSAEDPSSGFVSCGLDMYTSPDSPWLGTFPRIHSQICPGCWYQCRLARPSNQSPPRPNSWVSSCMFPELIGRIGPCFPPRALVWSPCIEYFGHERSRNGNRRQRRMFELCDAYLHDQIRTRRRNTVVFPFWMFGWTEMKNLCPLGTNSLQRIAEPVDLHSIAWRWFAWEKTPSSVNWKNSLMGDRRQHDLSQLSARRLMVASIQQNATLGSGGFQAFIVRSIVR